MAIQRRNDLLSKGSMAHGPPLSQSPGVYTMKGPATLARFAYAKGPGIDKTRSLTASGETNDTGARPSPRPRVRDALSGELVVRIEGRRDRLAVVVEQV